MPRTVLSFCRRCSEDRRGGRRPHRGLRAAAGGGGRRAVCRGGRGGYRAGLSQHIRPSTLFSLGVTAPTPSQLPLALRVLRGGRSIPLGMSATRVGTRSPAAVSRAQVAGPCPSNPIPTLAHTSQSLWGIAARGKLPLRRTALYPMLALGRPQKTGSPKGVRREGVAFHP